MDRVVDRIVDRIVGALAVVIFGEAISLVVGLRKTLRSSFKKKKSVGRRPSAAGPSWARPVLRCLLARFAPAGRAERRKVEK